MMYLNIQGAIKNRQYPILVPFLPVRHDITDKNWIDTIENKNKNPLGSIASVRWAKPIEQCSANQCVAHAVFILNTPNAANSLLRDGLTTGKTKLHLWKEKRDPIRCVKCQGYGHSARTCTATHNTCASCRQDHKTDKCNNNNHLFCVGCKSRGHASEDPLCPTYQRKVDEINTKHPENLMPYYPTHEPWTHSLLPPKTQPHYSPTSNHHANTITTTTTNPAPPPPSTNP
jgi:hypothetical protein